MKLDLGKSVNVRRDGLRANMGDKLWPILRVNSWGGLAVGLRVSLRGNLGESLWFTEERR